MLSAENVELLRSIRARHGHQKIVFASGSFDLPHAGHVLFLEDCKNLGDVLVIAIGNDNIIRTLKGEGRPIMNEHLRSKLIASLKPVDYCFVDSTLPHEEPLGFIGEVFEHLKPALYVVNDDAFNIPYREAMSKKHQVELVILERSAPPEFENVSTTGIVARIKDLK